MQPDGPLFQPGDLLIKRWEPDAGTLILITHRQLESLLTYSGVAKSQWTYQLYQGGRFSWVDEHFIKWEYKTEKSSPPIAAGG